MVLHRTRDSLVRQRTQIGNAIRAHMTEFGIITAKGVQNVERLKEQVDQLPQAVRMPLILLLDQLSETNTRIERLTDEIEETHSQSETSQRLATIPGVGVLSATIAATTSDVDNFDCARDYAAWLGLAPKPHSTGGKQRVGAVSKMGDRYIRRLLSRRHGADHAPTSAQAGARSGLAVGHAHAQEDEDCRDCLGASHGTNDFCRPRGRVSIRAAGRLTAPGMVRAT